MGITGYEQLFNPHFLRDCHIRVPLGSILSEKHALIKRLPQGCVLSPSRFNWVMFGFVAFPRVSLKTSGLLFLLSTYVYGLQLGFTRT